MRQFWESHAFWSYATFGPSKGAAGPLAHLAKEVREAAEDPSDVTEFADCLMLLFDAARRAGHTYDTLLSAAWRKLEINKGRTWKPANPDGSVEHVK